MTARDFQWSAPEKKIARQAFDKAYEAEIASIRNEVKQRANSIKEAEDIWELHDYLREKRKGLNQKYDYRYSVLIYVFARLLAQGFLNESDLAGLAEDKLAAIQEFIKKNPEL